jgi:hypothetical protein
VIHNAVIHIANEQPLLADLYQMPTSTDVSLVCTNVRALDGKKPIFIDHTDSTFFFPYLHLRFLEIPAGEMQRHLADAGMRPAAEVVPGVSLDADDPANRYPVIVAGGPEEISPDEPPDADEELDIDEDFLRRIREV